MRWSGRSGANKGKNPSSGVVLSYFIGEELEGPLSIQIRDKDGDLVRLYNDNGETFCYAVIIDGLLDGVCATQKQFKGSNTPGGLNVNVLNSEMLTDFGMSPTFYSVLVEIEKAPKPIASCAMPAADGMVIKTNTETVKKARKGVMEFLLINHPLDCPICDQGGECDLQDQAMYYGFDKTRYEENKRAVQNKNMGPLVKTIMTRCIHCTRCVRFSTEVAGVDDIGLLGRGENAEITTYLEKTIESELSGNVIDLCPVGALTSKPYAFKSRPWELTKTETFDVFDGIGSSIRIDTRGKKVLRALPRINEETNEEWISDKSRFAVDGLSSQRLDNVYSRSNKKLQKSSWDDAFELIKKEITKRGKENTVFLSGKFTDIETLYSAQKFSNSLKSKNYDCRFDNTQIIDNSSSSYKFNSTIQEIEKADAILLIGSNPRWEAAVLNLSLIHI